MSFGYILEEALDTKGNYCALILGISSRFVEIYIEAHIYTNMVLRGFMTPMLHKKLPMAIPLVKMDINATSVV